MILPRYYLDCLYVRYYLQCLYVRYYLQCSGMRWSFSAELIEKAKTMKKGSVSDAELFDCSTVKLDWRLFKFK